MNKKNSIALTVTIALLVTGNLIGAGLLGLPINTGIEGFIPALISMLVFGGMMFFSAWVLGKEAVANKEESFNYPSLYQSYLGKGGKWIAICTNLLILYGLLVAYLTGATSIIAHLFNITKYDKLILIVLFIIFTSMALLGIGIIRRYNVVLVVLLWFSFIVIILIAEAKIETQRLLYTDWNFIPMAAPIIITSFFFHNIIPNVCHSLKWQFSTVWKCILFGMMTGYIMNAIWIEVGVGVLPLSGGRNSLLHAYNLNLPATIPMARILHSKLFTVCSMLFALLAITTSYVTFAIGLLGFNRDLINNILNKSSKQLVYLLSFGPPLILALVYPNIFLKALSLVGGIGIVVLFGMLPALIFFIRSRGRRKRQLFAIVMFIAFGLIFVFQVCEEFGLVNITPKAVTLHKQLQKH